MVPQDKRAPGTLTNRYQRYLVDKRHASQFLDGYVSATHGDADAYIKGQGIILTNYAEEEIDCTEADGIFSIYQIMRDKSCDGDNACVLFRDHPCFCLDKCRFGSFADCKHIEDSGKPRRVTVKSVPVKRKHLTDDDKMKALYVEDRFSPRVPVVAAVDLRLLPLRIGSPAVSGVSGDNQPQLPCFESSTSPDFELCLLRKGKISKDKDSDVKDLTADQFRVHHLEKKRELVEISRLRKQEDGYYEIPDACKPQLVPLDYLVRPNFATCEHRDDFVVCREQAPRVVHETPTEARVIHRYQINVDKVETCIRAKYYGNNTTQAVSHAVDVVANADEEDAEGEALGEAHRMDDEAGDLSTHTLHSEDNGESNGDIAVWKCDACMTPYEMGHQCSTTFGDDSDCQFTVCNNMKCRRQLAMHERECGKAADITETVPKYKRRRR